MRKILQRFATIAIFAANKNWDLHGAELMGRMAKQGH